MDINSIVERVELIDFAGQRGFLELFVGYGDVALFGIEEAPTDRVSMEHRGFDYLNGKRRTAGWLRH